MKLLLFASAWLAAPSFAKSPFPELPCGRYRIEGTLKRDERGLFRLIQDFGTYAPRPFFLVGGSALDKMNRVNQHVAAEVYVPNPIGDTGMPILFLQSFPKPSGATKTDSVRKLAAAKCRDQKLRPH